MTTVTIKGIPEDVSKFILKVQGELKIKTGKGMLHQGQAIIHIVKEYKKIIDNNE